MLAAGLVAGSTAEPSHAASANVFDPGLIISDARFYDGKAMTEAQIQAFLVGKGSALANYRTTVKSRPAAISDQARPGHVYCTAITGGSDVLASTLIHRIQTACGISAKVILVTLEKERSLVTGRFTAQGLVPALNVAMGYGCPDTAACNTTYYGLDNQVYLAARQFKYYQLPENGFRYRPGPVFVQFHPDAARCGGTTVNIRNYATASLYNYTPYQPNAKALASYPGTGDSCSSYGNRNFWFMYKAWFGSPTAVIPTGVTVERVGGANRYEVAVGVSKRNFAPGVPVVYISTGQVFSDALSAGPAAALEGGPVLLVQPSGIPTSVQAEITRLAPQRIVVVGGAPSVSEAVYQKLGTLAPSIERVAGPDRYVVSRNLAESVFAGSGADIAYLATGATFADALSASAAAGTNKAPVILVKGTNQSLDEETRATLVKLGVKSVVIAGGPPSVSAGIEASLRTMLGDEQVIRYGGRDRYEVSAALNSDSFDSADTVYVASGLVFPDALSGSPVAGKNSSPLYVVRSTCIPTEVVEHIVKIGATKMVILGGPPTVATSVEKFTNC